MSRRRRPSRMIVRVSPSKHCSRRSVAGRAVARLGLPADSPASDVRAAARRWRTTNSSRVRTRNPIDSSRIRPVS